MQAKEWKGKGCLAAADNEEEDDDKARSYCCWLSHSDKFQAGRGEKSWLAPNAGALGAGGGIVANPPPSCFNTESPHSLPANYTSLDRGKGRGKKRSGAKCLISGVKCLVEIWVRMEKDQMRDGKGGGDWRKGGMSDRDCTGGGRQKGGMSGAGARNEGALVKEKGWRRKRNERRGNGMPSPCRFLVGSPLV